MHRVIKIYIKFFNGLHFATRGNVPLILGGDFNCVMHVNDQLCETTNTTCFVGRKELIDVIHIFVRFWILGWWQEPGLLVILGFIPSTLITENMFF